jgi:hypothetical protein
MSALRTVLGWLALPFAAATRLAVVADECRRAGQICVTEAWQKLAPLVIASEADQSQCSFKTWSREQRRVFRQLAARSGPNIWTKYL